MCEGLLIAALRRADERLLEAMWLSSRPPIMDAEPMTKAEIIMRRMEAIANHSYHIDGEVSASSLRDYDEAMRMALTPVEPEKFIYREQVYIPGVGVF